MEAKRLSYKEADLFQYYLEELPQVTKAVVYERTADAVICYQGERSTLLKKVAAYRCKDVKVPDGILEHSGRELNSQYQEKLVNKVLFHYGRKVFLPAPIAAAYTGFCSIKYIWKGIQTLAKGKIEVPVLDGTAIGVSVLRGDTATAGSIMFLLGIGELLEEWTHKKSVDDLARTMSLNVDKVWIKEASGQEVLVSASRIRENDQIVVHMGNVVPFDGTVSDGEAMLNQASLTGESAPVRKTAGNTVFAGTVVEEGEITVLVRKAGGSSRYEKIAAMIEESEKLKSGLESKAEHLADKLVPYTLAGTALTWLFTRNVTKALSVLMVDFSCALKLAMPLAVLSAMREASQHHITVKGGKFLEAVAEAETIVFDKTGTLTKAKPVVSDVVSFNGMEKEELLRIAACLEEHFPHSMANAVVQEAKKRHLVHEEMHSRVDYIVAHGIATYVGEERVVIGSHHFVFEDEKCTLPEDGKEKFENLPENCSHLYMAIGGQLAAVICIEDPLREEAASVIRQLKEAGFKRIVMMTGDSERTAAAIAKRVGVDDYFSEVLPEDKARFVEEEKAKGHKVIMIGDGINDSPALSAADAGIAVSEGAEIAREIADITIKKDSLDEVVLLRHLSMDLMKRVHGNYRFVISFNLGLILLGVAGIITPSMSALLHNSSTLAISLKSMTNLLPEEEREEA